MKHLQVGFQRYELRRAASEDWPQIINLVECVVYETYEHLFLPPAASIRSENWSQAWIAITANQILGVVMTEKNWIDDLWVRKESRGQGMGRQLLGIAQNEIILRGCREMRLSVVESNEGAIRFYERAGWRRDNSYPHEILPVQMVEMYKLA